MVRTKDLDKFKARLPDSEMKYVLEALKNCKFYLMKLPKSKSVRWLYLGAQITIVLLWLSFMLFLLILGLATWPNLIVTFVVFVGTVSILYFCYLKATMTTVKSKLVLREKSIKSVLNRLNSDDFWLNNDLIWRCGEFGAYLMIQTGDHIDKKYNRAQSLKKERESKVTEVLDRNW